VIKPTIGELLSGVATGLRERVLPEIPPGTTRRQIQAAIGIITRVALVWDKTAPYLYADNEDIAEALGRMLPGLEHVASREDNVRLGAACTKLRVTLGHSAQPIEPCPSAEVLGARNLELQEMLAEIQEAMHENFVDESVDRKELKATLYALFHRMLTRELEITRPTRRP
jgi:hypothetical protein